MNWICTTDFDFEKEHALTFEKRYKDTGDWLLEEPVFEQWFDVTDSRVFWCYGKRNKSLPNIIPFLLIVTSWSGKDGSRVCAPIPYPWILALLI